MGSQVVYASALWALEDDLKRERIQEAVEEWVRAGDVNIDRYSYMHCRTLDVWERTIRLPDELVSNDEETVKAYRDDIIEHYRTNGGGYDFTSAATCRRATEVFSRRVGED